jgi:alkanesulfonate monooxygenase SsuD/methylene tetrahydromethanopterin reductase-like flavin-dependent oxidoreductase (luciferase family)
MKVGLLVEAEEGLDWAMWRATFAAAERLGFESIWLSDHLQSPWGTRRGLETWTALTVAAAETRRLVLGPLVSPITFREPAIMEHMAATLQTLSGGRFVLGLGIGWNADEHAAAGIPFPPAAERSRHLENTIERLDCRVPVLIGGSGPRATLPLVARHAHQWNMTTASVADFTRASAHLDELCGEIGRAPSEIGRSIACGILVGRDNTDLHAHAERMRRCVPPLAAAHDVVSAAREMGWLAGTADDMVIELRRFEEAGAGRAVLGHYDLESVDTLELLAEAVLPAVA